MNFFLGLLIKQILQLADTDSRFREMKRNTIGVIFYSTPHHGSSLAKYSNQAKYMLYPSVEVQELDQGMKLWRDRTTDKMVLLVIISRARLFVNVSLKFQK